MCNVPPKFNQVCRLCLTLVNKHDVATLQIFDFDTTSKTASTSAYANAPTSMWTSSTINENTNTTRTTTIKAAKINNTTTKTDKVATIKQQNEQLQNESNNDNKEQQLNRSTLIAADMAKNAPITTIATETATTTATTTACKTAQQCNCVTAQQCTCDKTFATKRGVALMHALNLPQITTTESIESNIENVADDESTLTAGNAALKTTIATTAAPLVVPSAASANAISSTHVDTIILGQTTTETATTTTTTSTTLTTNKNTNETETETVKTTTATALPTVKAETIAPQSPTITNIDKLSSTDTNLTATTTTTTINSNYNSNNNNNNNNNTLNVADKLMSQNNIDVDKVVQDNEAAVVKKEIKLKIEQDDDDEEEEEAKEDINNHKKSVITTTTATTISTAAHDDENDDEHHSKMLLLLADDKTSTFNQSIIEPDTDTDTAYNLEHSDDSSTTSHITVQILNCLSIKVSHWSRVLVLLYKSLTT